MFESVPDFVEAYLQGGLTSLIDIALVAVIIYWVLILIRGTRAVRIVIGLLLLYGFYLAAEAFDLRLVSTLVQALAVVGLFAIVVVFQPELRRALEQIGRFGSVNRFFVSADTSAAERVARELSRACGLLAESRHGALIVLERHTGLDDVVTESGVRLDAALSAELLVTLFFPRTALHDGAVIVNGPRIVAAGVLLPLSNNLLDSERYGTRHRAAIGISEQTDAVVIVVSEETGSISLVSQGRIVRNLSEEKLRRALFSALRPQAARTAVPLLRRTLEGRWATGGRRGGRAAGEPERRAGSDDGVSPAPGRPPAVERRARGERLVGAAKDRRR